jgi:transmembrane sensor
MSKADDFNADIEAQARAWLVHMRSGKATAEDAQAFERWCAEHPDHARMAGMVSETWGALQSAAVEFRRRRAAAELAGTARATPRHAALRPGRRAFAGFALAAGAAWLALRPPMQLWPSLGDLAADYHTGTGEQRQVALSDRVVVEMNTQTRINVLAVDSAQGGAALRHGIELLGGEAEIVAAQPAMGRVEPIRPVVVVAGRGRLRADVARFDVRRTDDQVCVTCVSGLVLFEHPRQRSILSAGQQLIYNDRDLRVVAQVDTSAVTAWRQGLLVFNGVPLTQVIDEINRYRPGKLILRNAELGRRLVQAQFPLATLDDVGGMISSAYGAHVTKLPGGILLLS